MTTVHTDHAQAWPSVQAILRNKIGDDHYDSWFGLAHVESVTNSSGPNKDQYTVCLSVPTQFLKSWIVKHHMEALLSSWQARAPIAAVELTVRTPAAYVPTSVAERPQEERMEQRAHTTLTYTAPGSDDLLGSSPVDPKHTFSTFVVGRANALAHAAVKQVAEGKRGDAVMYNPLYVHAGVGLGKTHLLQAAAFIGNSHERRVLYMTAEKFVFEFAQALKRQSSMAFKEILRKIDVLIIDDLQFLQGRSAQAEFGHILNALIDSGRQVVVAADRPPGDLDLLDDRTRSRLVGGLVVEMGSLGQETRLNILKLKVAQARVYHPGLDIPEAVLEYMAGALTGSGRELEGAVKRLAALGAVDAQPISLEMAEREVRDLIRPQEPKRVKIEDIQRVVARHYNVSRADLLSARRTANVVRPRQIAMYLAKVLTLRSLPEIGRRFGGRDHTTVLHAFRKIEALVARDRELAEEIEMFERQLQE